jgi:hypothetical protein
MGGQSGGGTQTTEPPKWQRPFIETGLNAARTIFQNPGMRNAPMSDATQQGLHGIQNMAQSNPITGAAGNLAQQTLSGGFLGSNPWLDQTFNRAAMATQGQLASQFAGAGRNVDQSQGNRAQQLNDLAGTIYGGAYDAERNRMQQTLGMSPMLGQAQYGDFDRLLGVGQAREGYQQRDLDSYENSLDRYLGRVTGNMGSSTRTTQSGNPAAGALGGAMLGNQIFPGWGALGGGILGGIFG